MEKQAPLKKYSTRKLNPQKQEKQSDNLITKLFKEATSSLENTIKSVGFLISIFYVLGFIVISFYNSVLGIRVIEFINFNYILTGISLASIGFFVFILPITTSNKQLQLPLKMVGLSSAILSLNTFSADAIQHSLITIMKLRTSTPTGTLSDFYETLLLESHKVSQITTWIFIGLYILHVLVDLYLYIRKKPLKIPFLPVFKDYLLGISILLFLFLFISFFYPRGSNHLGGGRLQTVEITFNEQVPDSLLRDFALYYPVDSLYAEYYGKLLYVSSDSYFLKPYQWYKTEIYEIPKSMIKYFIYHSYLPSYYSDPNLVKNE